jgi:carboxypeptidase D
LVHSGNNACPFLHAKENSFLTEIYVDFQVTAALPNITFPLGRSFAGNLPVNRLGHPNDTLFFMGFEKSNGSLTAAANQRANEPWGIWLNGG